MKFRNAMCLLASALVLASCGGGGDDTTSSSDPSVDTTIDTTVGSGTTDPSATEQTDPADSSGDYTPGDIAFRVVNVSAEPVDVHVRTSGFVEAFPIASDVSTDSVVDPAYPPVDGALAVTKVGADPECVATCPDIIAVLSATADLGPNHTVLVYDDELGNQSTLDLWEDPVDRKSGFSNVMPLADPDAGLFVATAIAVTDADFGLRLSYGDGCVDSSTPGILIGGNQTPVFAYDGDSVEFTIHDNTDRECTGVPVGGPFTIDGGPGTRSHLILTGSPGALGTVKLGFLDGGSTSVDSDDPSEPSADADRDAAVEQMIPEVESGLGVPSDVSECVTGLIVDAIGPENLLDETGSLIDLDTLGPEFEKPTQDALVAAVDACGLDPSLFGG